MNRAKTLAVGYIRVSKEIQVNEGYSMDAQRSKIEAYAGLRDLRLVEIIEDAGLSAKSINGRPGIQRALELVRTGKVQHLIIFKLDRLARNTKEALEISELLQKKGASLHSVNENIDTASASGQLFFTMLAAFATWERQQISERTKIGLAVKRDRGERISGKAPYGYTFRGNEIIRHPSEQRIVAEMQRLRSEGLSLDRIGEDLFKAGMKNREGKRFSASGVYKILKSATTEKK